MINARRMVLTDYVKSVLLSERRRAPLWWDNVNVMRLAIVGLRVCQRVSVMKSFIFNFTQFGIGQTAD